MSKEKYQIRQEVSKLVLLQHIQNKRVKVRAVPIMVLPKKVLKKVIKKERLSLRQILLKRPP